MRRVAQLMALCCAMNAAAMAAAAQSDAGAAGGTGSGDVVPPPDLSGLIAPPTVSASVSAPQVTLGQVFYLFVRVVHPPDMQVNLPASLPLGPAFEESRRTHTMTANADGTVTRDFEIQLQAFEVGDLVIAQIPVTYAAQGRAQEIATNPVPVQVQSYIGEGEAELEDIAPPVAVERRDWTLVYLGLGVVGAIVLVGGFFVLRRLVRRRRTMVFRHGGLVTRMLPPDQEALARLDEVEAAGLLDADDRKPAYLAMSEILRAYIGRRFEFPALDLTTEEIRHQLDTRLGSPDISDLVCPWLEQSDLVKFAGHDASPDEAREDLYEVRRFIERTRAAAVAPAPAAQAAPAPSPPNEARS